MSSRSKRPTKYSSKKEKVTHTKTIIMMVHNAVDRVWILHTSKGEKQAGHRTENQNGITFLKGDNEGDNKVKGKVFKILKEMIYYPEFYSKSHY